jgi:hypothetical protein
VTAERHRTHELWGRIAAKEAARRLWLEAGNPPVYPADLAVASGPHSQTKLFALANPGVPVAAVSIACSEGVAVAIAHADPHARVGIAVRSIAENPLALDASSTAAAEHILLGLNAVDRPEWIARLECAKEVTARTLGLAPAPAPCEITDVDESSGIVRFSLAPHSDHPLDVQPFASLYVMTQRRGEYVWAWTLMEGVDS